MHPLNKIAIFLHFADAKKVIFFSEQLPVTSRFAVFGVLL